MLTQERLKELLSYDPETGVWTWLVDRPGGQRAGRIVTNRESNGYIQFMVDGKNYQGHRLAWLYMTGEFPPDQVDHIDRNKSNNVWSNLRLATQSENRRNVPAFSSNSLGVKGVSRVAAPFKRPYKAKITINKKQIHLGYFDTIEEASAAYSRAADQLFGDFAYQSS